MSLQAAFPLSQMSFHQHFIYILRQVISGRNQIAVLDFLSPSLSSSISF